jgi:hypothetical protein
MEGGYSVFSRGMREMKRLTIKPRLKERQDRTSLKLVIIHSPLISAKQGSNYTFHSSTRV